MHNIVIKILQGSIVTQIVLCGLTIYPPVANYELLKLVSSRQSYCNNNQSTFWTTPYLQLLSNAASSCLFFALQDCVQALLYVTLENCVKITGQIELFTEQTVLYYIILLLCDCHRPNCNIPTPEISNPPSPPTAESQLDRMTTGIYIGGVMA